MTASPQRRALVTGAASGIGAAIAARLRDGGLEVLTLDRAPGCELTLDVCREDLSPGGDVDVCVACAGITDTIAPGHRFSDDLWQRDVDVNLTGAFRTVRACLPSMRERRYGRVIVVSSVAALAGLPGQVAYAASKAGQLGMVYTLAAENADRGITVNAVLPGLTATERVRAMPGPVLSRALAALPTGRAVEPAEIAELVAFLAGESAGQLTGQAIAVDGGASLNTLTLGSERRA
jgi:acetoacetyl-CoA reductase